MVETIQKDDRNLPLAERAIILLKETKALQIVKSANMLIDLFGMEKAFKRIKPEREGQQIEMKFPALNNSITFTLVSKKDEFNCIFGEADDPVATLIMNVKNDKVLKTLASILSIKDNLFGLVKMLPKLLTRKIKIKGSYIAAILLCRCMFVGKHPIYKGQL